MALCCATFQTDLGPFQCESDQLQCDVEGDWKLESFLIFGMETVVELCVVYTPED